ncbi:uncharacterized protein BDR25DRAFT_317020 [Lindgomyces ingoldianus]|uniref:Uncharacterized protein n=1 Tax=Lindgomyces ingoldianus TaxID=673940 RepID=A0ACB6QJR4_9PLEO|nr:uncharacterized protein BDR25DRAFT_317020 [Lindgomyces ingoldianus]KAF2467264.1 hypothetical protein BDR25DRAFT_317020 [Lindgomyces ingoldianus]
MSRPRLPSALAWLQLTVRVLALLTSIGCLITTIYISLNFHKTNPMTYVALLWAILLDNLEILALCSNPGDMIKRIHLCPLITLEVLGLFFFLISFFVTFIAEWHPRREGSGWNKGEQRPGDEYKLAQELLVFSVMGLHVVIIIICCIDGCTQRRRPMYVPISNIDETNAKLTRLLEESELSDIIPGTVAGYLRMSAGALNVAAEHQASTSGCGRPDTQSRMVRPDICDVQEVRTVSSPFPRFDGEE